MFDTNCIGIGVVIYVSKLGSGKVFEQDVANSISKDRFFVHRLKDTAQSYNNSGLTSFAWSNPCDLFVYNPNNNILFTIEEKTTKYNSFTFDNPCSTEKESKMIKRHQILSLQEFAKYNGVFPMFLFNFREVGDDKVQVTYAQHINDFMKMIKNINGKKSFNLVDLIKNNAIRIEGQKKRTRYFWCIEDFFNSKTIENF